MYKVIANTKSDGLIKWLLTWKQVGYLFKNIDRQEVLNIVVCKKRV